MARSTILIRTAAVTDRLSEFSLCSGRILFEGIIPADLLDKQRTTEKQDISSQITLKRCFCSDLANCVSRCYDPRSQNIQQRNLKKKRTNQELQSIPGKFEMQSVNVFVNIYSKAVGDLSIQQTVCVASCLTCRHNHSVCASSLSCRHEPDTISWRVAITAGASDEAMGGCSFDGKVHSCLWIQRRPLIRPRSERSLQAVNGSQRSTSRSNGSWAIRYFDVHRLNAPISSGAY